MSTETQTTALLSEAARSLILKYRGDANRLATWDKTARVLNQKGFRTKYGKKFTAATLTNYAKADSLPVNDGVMGSGWKRKGSAAKKTVPRRTTARTGWTASASDDTKLSDITEVMDSAFSDSLKLRMINTILNG